MNTCRRPFLWDEGPREEMNRRLRSSSELREKLHAYEAENASANVHKPLCMHMIA
jgi:hypothetical protein